MPDPDAPDLFTAAGVMLEDDRPKSRLIGRPKRQRKSAKPSPAERAAAVRLEGACRLRSPQAAGQRTRIGQPRDLGPAPVLAFPLARNGSVVAEVIRRLPHGYAPDLDKRRDHEVKILKNRLLKQGAIGQIAWRRARELVHIAYMECVRQAHKETGIL